MRVGPQLAMFIKRKTFPKNGAGFILPHAQKTDVIFNTILALFLGNKNDSQGDACLIDV